jgi:predicted dinucleotide-binding enzyme
MPDPAAQLVSYLMQNLVTIGGFGTVGGLTVLSFVKLRTEVRMFNEQNQKDHKRMTDELEKLNGSTRKATTDIAKLKATYEERHRDG